MANLVPEQELIPKEVKAAIQGSMQYLGGKAAAGFESIGKGLEWYFRKLAEEAKKPTVYEMVYPKKSPQFGKIPRGLAESSFSPEIVQTETTSSDGTKTKKVQVKVGGGGQSAKGDGGLDRSSMYTAIANAFQAAPRPELGYSMADVQVPDIPSLSGANERARRTYAPFLPREGEQMPPWQRFTRIMANALNQTDQERQAYYNALDQNYRLNFEQKVQKEQQKRLKMQSQLAEEATLAQLQKYQQQQQASEQLAAMFTRYGPQIFADPELNMGASTLMDRAGLSYGATRMPMYKPHKASQFDLFFSELRQKNPSMTVEEATKRYAEAKKTGGSAREKELRKLLFPTNVTNKMLAAQSAQDFMSRVVQDPAYLNSLREEGVDVQDMVYDIELIYGNMLKQMEGRE